MTRDEIRFVRSLGDKRARDESGLFVAEGRKAVEELTAGGLQVREIYTTSSEVDALRIDRSTMERISRLTTPTEVLAVVEKPRYEFRPAELREKLVLALDDVQNPGNVGTIIRLAEWFGISDVLCGAATADVFGPKVVQATMGALARVRVHYGELGEMIGAVGGRNTDRGSAENSPQTQPFGSESPTSAEVYGAFLEGENIYRANLSSSGIVVLGSEGRGISASVERLVTRRIFIPPFADHHPESLNVAIAGAIICSEFSRSRVQSSSLELPRRR